MHAYDIETKTNQTASGLKDQFVCMVISQFIKGWPCVTDPKNLRYHKITYAAKSALVVSVPMISLTAG